MTFGKKETTIILIVCVTVAGILYWKSGNKEPKASIINQAVLKCSNESCGQVVKMSKKEFEKQLQQINPENLMGPHIMLKCPHCSQNTLTLAEKCDKCGELFIPDYSKDDFRDRCTKCGYSPSESEIVKDRK